MFDDTCTHALCSLLVLLSSSYLLQFTFQTQEILLLLIIMIHTHRNNMIENSKVPINALLSQPLASESYTATDPDLSFKRSANGVKFESLKTHLPINHRNVHWLCLKVSMVNKLLWDSSGVKESNQLYLTTLLRYLKDKFRATSPQEDADDWIAQWTTLDDSANCPRQYNGYD